MEPRAADAPRLTTQSAAHRAVMATVRTRLALERTTLASIRTSLVRASFGFGVIAWSRSLRQANRSARATRLHGTAIRFGVALSVPAIAATAPAGQSHASTLRRLGTSALVEMVAGWRRALARARRQGTSATSLLS